MTTHRVRDPTVIHFTIDGRHGILRARHIAEALHIPYEHVSPADYREWTHLSQSDMVRILSRGTSTRSFLFRKELMPNMFFLDTLQHISTSSYDAEERSYTEGLVQDIKGFLLWPS